jgi:hypothetical protein
MTTKSQTSILREISNYKRHGFPWNTNEINRLYNEYEIKEFTIRQIAKLHFRTYKAILNRLEVEGLILSDWSDARGAYEMTD